MDFPTICPTMIFGFLLKTGRRKESIMKSLLGARYYYLYIKTSLLNKSNIFERFITKNMVVYRLTGRSDVSG